MVKVQKLLQVTTTTIVFWSLITGIMLPITQVAVGQTSITDFNHDYTADLAIGVPGETLGSGVDALIEAGAVHALYGSQSSGITGTGSEFWTQDITNLLDQSEAYDHFGGALAIGNFDGYEGYDLAVGVPQQTVNGHPNAGAIHILYGFSSDGLSTQYDEVWNQDTGTLGSNAEDNDYFGRALASGDFDGDGYDDLAIGVPYETWNLGNAGIVQVLYGTGNGFTDTGSQLWRQGANGLPESENIGDQFGEALAVGDFDRDGYDDLAIGASNEDFEGTTTRYDVGVVHILYGTDGGLTATDTQLWHQDLSGLLDDAEQYDAFGHALVAADFDGDGYDDLAIGVPGENIGGDDYAGAVHVLPGSGSGLITHGDYLVDQDALTVGAEANDHFGSALASSDFNGDGYADLAVGTPDEDFGLNEIGTVDVLYGSRLGLATTGNNAWYQGVLTGLADEVETADQFGEVLTAGDFNGDSYGDLAIGVPYEDVVYDSVNQADAGAVHILYGTGTGLSNQNDTFWTQASAGLTGVPEEDDRFGYALVALPTPFQRLYLPLVTRGS